MKLFPAFLCFFLFVLGGGTISFVYIMWTNYWARIQAMETHYLAEARISHPKAWQHRSPNSRHSLARIDKDELGEAVVRDIKAVPKLVPKKEAVPWESLPLDKLLAHIAVFKEQLFTQLRNTVLDTAKQVQDENFPNAYNVSYRGHLADNTSQVPTPQQLLCDAKHKIRLKTFTKDSEMFKRLKLDRFFPAQPLLEHQSFNTCAVVSSSGSLHGSGLGAFIDTHDLVLRFNNAPTDKHEEDVGRKTDIRIVNSQVVAKPQFKFLEDEFYSKSAVLVWDPSVYNATLEQWYNKPDWPFFEQFFSKRLMTPEDPLFLLNPESLWSMWNWLQSVTSWPLLPTPPSSGFLGVMLLLHHCSLLHVFEYIPSMRLTKRCHYYDIEDNLGCTLGDWHPLSAEKLVSLNLNIGTDLQVYKDGYITIPGFSSCDKQ